MSLAGIKKKILAEAQKEKEEILAETGKERAKFDQEAEKKIAAIRENYQQDLARRRVEVKEQARIQAELAARNNLLKKKQDLIDQVFALVLAYYNKLSQSERKRILKRFLKSAVKELGPGDSYVLATKRDQDLLRDLVSEYPHLRFGKKTVPGEGGFVIANDLIELNYTFENLILEKRESLKSEVAKILFK